MSPRRTAAALLASAALALALGTPSPALAAQPTAPLSACFSVNALNYQFCCGTGPLSYTALFGERPPACPSSASGV
ncbi:hypothetical protein ABT354_35080 [Streptomyces sp. NPDC000594]|uniref:hypothetical protein n=1 Tax=Streptomyces sp. NPDC000594 TaxID=3154261 RepID=UPI00332B3BE6